MKAIYTTPEITEVELDRGISLQLASDANPMVEPDWGEWAQMTGEPSTDLFGMV